MVVHPAAYAIMKAERTRKEVYGNAFGESDHAAQPERSFAGAGGGNCRGGRQSYAKWEQGDTLPDVEKCARLAAFYGVTLDALVNQENRVGAARMAPAPLGKHLWGTVVLGSRGQIVIPKAARETFTLREGDRLVVLGDESEGIALVKAETFERKMQQLLEQGRHQANE